VGARQDADQDLGDAEYGIEQTADQGDSAGFMLSLLSCVHYKSI
jgi:hypothetical protein